MEKIESTRQERDNPKTQLANMKREVGNSLMVDKAQESRETLEKKEIQPVIVVSGSAAIGHYFFWAKKAVMMLSKEGYQGQYCLTSDRDIMKSNLNDTEKIYEDAPGPTATNFYMENNIEQVLKENPGKSVVFITAGLESIPRYRKNLYVIIPKKFHLEDLWDDVGHEPSSYDAIYAPKLQDIPKDFKEGENLFFADSSEEIKQAILTIDKKTKPKSSDKR